MGKSYKKAIIHDKGMTNSSYNRKVRRVNNSIVKSIKSIDECYDLNSEFLDVLDNESDLNFLQSLPNYVEDTIKNPKQIINDYDFRDYTFNYENEQFFGNKWYSSEEYQKDKIKNRRK